MKEVVTAEDVHAQSKGSQGISIGVIDNLVFIEMEKSTKWFAMPKDIAMQFAKSIIDQANTIIIN